MQKIMACLKFRFQSGRIRIKTRILGMKFLSEIEAEKRIAAGFEKSFQNSFDAELSRSFDWD